jgi:adenylate kinase family enzyme
MNTPRRIFFVGHSASGKGTQAKLLKEHFDTKDGNATTILETGARFRTFIEGETYTQKKTKQYIEDGKLPPAFLGVSMWSTLLIEKYEENQNYIIDGTPRVSSEVPLWEGAFDFYDWYPSVIELVVSDEWAKEKMIHRGRSDDKDVHDVDERVAWFHSSVTPALSLLEKNPRVTYIRINGEQTIEEVHAEVCRIFSHE